MLPWQTREYSLNATLNIDLFEKFFGKKMEILFQNIYTRTFTIQRLVCSVSRVIQLYWNLSQKDKGELKEHQVPALQSARRKPNNPVKWDFFHTYLLLYEDRASTKPKKELCWETAALHQLRHRPVKRDSQRVLEAGHLVPSPRSILLGIALAAFQVLRRDGNDAGSHFDFKLGRPTKHHWTAWS